MDSRKAILIKAKQLFLQHGVKSVSVDDLAMGLAISKKTVYRFFNQKEEILKGVLNELIAESAKEIDAIRSSNLSPISELREFGLLLNLKFEQTNKNFWPEIRKYFPKIWEKYFQLIYTFF